MKQRTGYRREREMKQLEESIETCRAECIAVLAVTGAIAQGLILMDPKHHAAVCSALDVAVRSLRSAAVAPDGSIDAVAIDALGLVARLRDSVPPAKPHWPAASETWGHA
jgi:hypothetical protein